MQILWSGLLQFYGIISINLDSSRSQIGVHELTKFEEPDIEDLNNVLGSSWRGYIWKKEPDSVNIKDLNDVFTFTENRLKLTVARLENTNLDTPKKKSNWFRTHEKKTILPVFR